MLLRSGLGVDCLSVGWGICMNYYGAAISTDLLTRTLVLYVEALQA